MEASRELSRAVIESGVVEKLARFGYLAHGFIYIIIGGLAAQLAIGAGGSLTGPAGAIETIQGQPFGDFVVFLTAIGLAGYAIWRLVQAVVDPDKQGTGMKGLAVRIGRVASGAGYGALALFAAKLAAGGPESPDGNMNWATQILTAPLGATIGGLAALIVFGVAVEDARKACAARFGERLQSGNMNRIQRFWSRCAGWWGFATRSLILCVAGAFVFRAAWYAEPDEVKGLAGVLASLLSLPFGNWVLAAAGLGLAAYGFFMILVARYRRHPS